MERKESNQTKTLISLCRCADCSVSLVIQWFNGIMSFSRENIRGKSVPHRQNPFWLTLFGPTRQKTYLRG